jgi:4-hydroxy-tetrahydrodipicolinate synthase
MKKINDYPLWTAIITPMTITGEVDYKSLEAVLREQEQAENGILILGSTGEALNLDLEDQQRILEFALALGLNTLLMCGVGGINLRQTKQWVEYLNTLNLDAYLMVTPLYAKPGPEGQYQWFKELMDLSTKPVMLYNVPSRTGISLAHSAVQRLADHKNLWAIKEASGSVAEFAKYVTDAPHARVYSGDDALLPDFVDVGAFGLVSVSANVWPRETHRYTRLALANELLEIRLWKESTNAMFCVSNPIPAKALLYKLGRIETPVLRAPLTHKELTDDTIIVEANKNITNWYNQYNSKGNSDERLATSL